MGVSTPVQVETLIKLGFHKAIGCYEADLESSAGQPPDKEALLVVSEKAMSLSKQCELLGIQCRLSLLDLDKHRNLIVVPDRALFWVCGADDGRSMRNEEPDVAMAKLKEKNRHPATTAITLAIFRRARNVSDHSFFVDAVGSLIDGFYVPTLMLDNGDTCLMKFGKTEKTSERWGIPSFERAM